MGNRTDFPKMILEEEKNADVTLTELSDTLNTTAENMAPTRV